MVRLELFQQDDFEQFLEHAISEEASVYVRNGNWPAKGALERSNQEFEHYLPDGIHCKRN